jgi:beta-phosphoglucomutase-like phosphatase (HAD superfamily)
VVIGSSKKDVKNILDHAIGFGKEHLDVIITPDKVTNGKPAPFSLLPALEKMKLMKTGLKVVENAAIGVEAVDIAGIPTLVVLNNRPLLYFKPFATEERILKSSDGCQFSA